MKVVFKIVGILVIILVLNFIASLLFVKKNDSRSAINKYIESSKVVKIQVNDEHFSGKFTHESYLKRILIFKGIYGNSQDEIVFDNFSNKYFKIMRFEKYGEKYSLPQTSLIKNKELYVKVDPLEINNSSFGTKENPILVFSYKGINDDFIMDMDTDEKDESGIYKQAPISIAPTEEEYRYNVEQYLTYVMPKEEFKKRFK